MKKIFIMFFVLILSSANAQASGPYDGIWVFDPYGYANVTERNGVVVAVFNYNQDYSGIWEAFMGNRSVNFIRFKTIIGYTDTIIDLNVDSGGNAIVTQVSCTPSSGSYCLFQDGQQIHGYKVW